MKGFKEKPILMSAPMVRATLREVDPKTETRRVVKEVYDGEQGAHVRDHLNKKLCFMPCKDMYSTGTEKSFCPYGVPGDRLWVREAWAGANTDDGPAILYRADNDRRYLMHEPDFLRRDPTGRNGESFDYKKTGRVDFSYWAGDIESKDKGWKPSIHMPRWASRIDILITNVRVERLHDIMEAGARAEGTPEGLTYAPVPSSHFFERPALSEQIKAAERMANPPMTQDWRTGYRRLWENINGAGSWDVNPWVWVVQFERIRPA